LYHFLEGQHLAANHGCKFIEISTTLDMGVHALKMGLSTQIYLRQQQKQETENRFNHHISIRSRNNSTVSSKGLPNWLSQTQRKIHRSSFAAATNSSFKLAQKVVDKIIMSFGATTGAKSKSCVDLYRL